MQISAIVPPASADHHPPSPYHDPSAPLPHPKKPHIPADSPSLLPGLPDELALLCLSRLPLRVRARCRSISRSLLHTLSDDHLLHHYRLVHGISAHYLLFLCLTDRSSCRELDAGSDEELVNGTGPLWLILDPIRASCIVLFDIQSPSVYGSLNISCQFPIRMLPGHKPGQVLIRGLVSWLCPVSGMNFAQGDTIITFDVVSGRCCSTIEGSDHTVGRMDFAWVYLDENLYIAGGWCDEDYDDDDDFDYDDDDDVHSFYMCNAERYNFTTTKWETLPNMLQKRQSCTGFAMNGCVYLLGGFSEEDEPLDSGEFFNPNTGTWTLVPDMWPYEQSSLPRVAVVNDQLYAIRPSTTEIIRYDASKNCWTLVTYLPKYCKAAKGHRIAGVGDELWAILNHDDKSIDVVCCTPQQLQSKPSLYNWRTPCFNLPKDLQLEDLVVVEI